MATKAAKQAKKRVSDTLTFMDIFHVSGSFFRSREFIEETVESLDVQFHAHVEAFGTEIKDDNVALVTNIVIIKGILKGEDKKNPVFEIVSESDLLFFADSKIEESDLFEIELMSLSYGWPYARLFAIECADKIRSTINLPVSTPPKELVTFASQEKKQKVAKKKSAAKPTAKKAKMERKPQTKPAKPKAKPTKKKARV